MDMVQARVHYFQTTTLGNGIGVRLARFLGHLKSQAQIRSLTSDRVALSNMNMLGLPKKRPNFVFTTKMAFPKSIKSSENFVCGLLWPGPGVTTVTMSRNSGSETSSLLSNMAPDGGFVLTVSCKRDPLESMSVDRRLPVH